MVYNRGSGDHKIISSNALGKVTCRDDVLVRCSLVYTYKGIYLGEVEQRWKYDYETDTETSSEF